MLLAALLSLFVLLAAYQVHPFSQLIDIGSNTDNTFVSRFYASEQNQTFDYRWTRDQSDVTLYQAGTPYRLTFRAWTSNPANRVDVAVVANGQEIGRVQVDQTPQVYTLQSSKISWGPEDLTLTFRAASTFSETFQGGRGLLGIGMDWVKVEPYANRLGLITPPPFQMVWWLLVVFWPLALRSVLRLPVTGRRFYLLPLANLLIIAILFCVPATSAQLHSDWALTGLQIGLLELALGVAWVGFERWRSKELFRRNIPKVSMLLMLLALACFYMAIARGRLSFGDDHLMEAVTAAIVSGNPAAPLTRFLPSVGTLQLQYAPFGIGLSIVGVPLYIVGNWLSDLLPSMLSERTGSAGLSVFVLLFTDLCLTVGAVFLFYRFQRLTKIGPRAALVTAALFAIGTMACYYSRTFMSEPLVAFCILAALVSGLYYRQSGKWAWAGLSGFMVGLAFATRVTNLTLVPLFGLFMLWCWWDRRSAQDKAAWVNSVKSLIGPALVWIIGVAFWAAIVCWYNYARFGSISNTGYSTSDFSTPFLTGFYGLLFSPGKSVFLYNPVLLLGLAGFPLAFKRHRPVAILALAIFAAYVGVYSLWMEWYGGGVWGPRPLVPILSIILWPAGYIFAFLDSPARTFKWSLKAWSAGLVIGLIIAASLVVQFLGVMIDYQIYVAQYGPNRNPELFKLAINDPAYSPIVEHWRLLVDGTKPDLAFRFYHETPFARLTDFVYRVGLLLSGGFILLALGLYWRKPRFENQGKQAEQAFTEVEPGYDEGQPKPNKALAQSIRKGPLKKLS